MGAFSQLLPARALTAALEPYKKLLGVLVRQNCISIAVSNPYLNLAEPLGAVMLREGRLPGRSFQRLLAGEQQQLAGFVMAYEVEEGMLGQQLQQEVQAALTQPQGEPMQLGAAAITAQQQAAAAQVQAALEALRPGLQGGWYGAWSAEAAGTSCRIQAPAGPSAAAAVDGAPAASSAAEAQQAQQQQGEAPQSSGNSEATLKPAEDGKGAQQQPVCSFGQQFLQSYLDSIGSLNTFG